jgi:ribonuclease Z
MPNAAVIAAGRVVVIDSGPGAWSRLAAANISGAKIDTVLLTHLHSDHIGDLGEVATQSWLGGRKVPLEVYGPGTFRTHHRRRGRDLRRGGHRGRGEGLR